MWTPSLSSRKQKHDLCERDPSGCFFSLLIQLCVVFRRVMRRQTALRNFTHFWCFVNEAGRCSSRQRPAKFHETPCFGWSWHMFHISTWLKEKTIKLWLDRLSLAVDYYEKRNAGLKAKGNFLGRLECWLYLPSESLGKDCVKTLWQTSLSQTGQVWGGLVWWKQTKERQSKESRIFSTGILIISIDLLEDDIQDILVICYI